MAWCGWVTFYRGTSWHDGTERLQWEIEARWGCQAGELNPTWGDRKRNHEVSEFGNNKQHSRISVCVGVR